MGAAAHIADLSLYALVRAVAGTINVAGLEESAHVAERAGALWARSRFNRARHERAKANIRWAFPGFPEERVERTAVAAYEHLFRLVPELAAAPRRLTPDRWRRDVRLGEIGEALGALTAPGPKILITGHCGNWEALGYTLTSLGVPLHALYRPLNQQPIDRWVRRTRASRGLRLLDKFGAIAQAPAILARGEALGFIADQNAGDRGVFVPFFGRLASAYKSIGLLAIQHEASIICGAALRLAPGSKERFVLEANEVITPDEWADRQDPLFYITARYRRAIETTVRSAPEQYLWMHRAWKSRPRHERAGKPFPPKLREKLESLPWMTPDSLERITERSARDAAEIAARAK